MPKEKIISIRELINAINNISYEKHEPIKCFAKGEIGELIEVLNKLILNLHKKSIENEKRLNEKVFSLYELNYATKMISFATEIKELLDIAVDMLLEMAKVEKCSLMLFDSERKELIIKIIKDGGKVIYPENKLKDLKGILSEAIYELKPYLINNLDGNSLEDLGDNLSQGATSFLCMPLMGKEKVIGVVNLYNCLDSEGFTQDDLNLISSLVSHIGISLENAQLFAEIKELFFMTVRALASTIDAKDPYTYGHSERVSQYSLEIAKKLGLSTEEQENIQLAALLHDIGKIGIPDEILHKPDKLTLDEFSIIQKHPIKGSMIMEHIKQLSKIIPGMRQHHERFSGGGYPDGLKGQEISLAGKIISVADAFDAMTSDRAYRKGISKEEALSRIKDCSEIQFDPTVVEAFIKISENRV